MKNFFNTIVFALLLGLIMQIFAAPLVLAFVASSTNYRIQTDGVSDGGGLATSTSYSAQDTAGEVMGGVGTSSSASYGVKAGYLLMQDTYLAVAVPGSITLAPAILSVGGGTANGSGVWTVTTDNPAGYTMTIKASANPAFASGANNFPNYTPVAPDPDFTFSPPAASSRFGFSPESTDLSSRYKDNGTACNTGALDTASSCWDALTTTDRTIVSRTTPNNPSGTATTIRFRAVSGASNTQAAGTYTATTTLTVLAL